MTTHKTRARQASSGWWRIENAAGDAGDEAVVWLYDQIAWFAINAGDLVPEIAAIKASRISLRINSPGGDVFDAVAIFNALREHPAQVEARIDGLAASAASFISQAAERVVMNRHAMLMIHDPWGITIGDAGMHRQQAELLDKIGDDIASIYAGRAGGSVREWRERMLVESWFDDHEAVEAGLADEVAGEAAVDNRFDLSAYRNTPARLRGQRPAAATTPTLREIEEALRDVGLTQIERKRIAAALRGDIPRDVDGLGTLLAALRRMTV